MSLKEKLAALFRLDYSMAKMFYTLEETKKALGRSEEEIKQFSREGRLREFRDGPRLMFKADQVDNLASEIGHNEADRQLNELLSDGEIADVASAGDERNVSTEPTLGDFRVVARALRVKLKEADALVRRIKNMGARVSVHCQSDQFCQQDEQSIWADIYLPFNENE